MDPPEGGEMRNLKIKIIKLIKHKDPPDGGEMRNLKIKIIKLII